MINFSERQLQIINAAIELIAEQGIQGFTTANLAAKISISEAGLYRHFGNKVEILKAVLEYFGDQKKLIFEEILVRNIGAIEKIEAIFQHHFETFTSHPAIAAVIFSEGIFQNDALLAKQILKIMDSAKEVFLKIISSADNNILRNDIPSEHLTLIIMGSLRLIVNKWYLSKHSFNLQEEGTKLWKSLHKLIVK